MKHGELPSSRVRYAPAASYVPVLVPKHLVLGAGSQELSEELYPRRRPPPSEPQSTEEDSRRFAHNGAQPDASSEESPASTEDGGRGAGHDIRSQMRSVYARRPSQPELPSSSRPTLGSALWIPRASRGVYPPLTTTHWRGMDTLDDGDRGTWKHSPGQSYAARRILSRVRRGASAKVMSSTTAAAASGFIPIAGPFGGQELAYSAFLDGGSSTPFPAGFSSYASPSRQQHAKEAYGGSLDYGRSATSAFSGGYDSLGSGNFQLIRGGVYADDQASSSHVPYYVHGPSSSYSPYSYDEDAGGPVLGFQGFEHFGSPLHNALSKHSHVLGASTEHRTHASTPKPLSVEEDQMRATE
ncbi:hypothetical protein HPB48_017556 [Haemaphysalis longicornis]|uniref:Uncharacterized protein n=1 Tax=Haemaphysalis longicornis TaxID=44386 RepID=A0A9J6FJS2_HAELO|nr:hypothetical protein HPB48_017556 [Haemaphysalis longicornis]